MIAAKVYLHDPAERRSVDRRSTRVEATLRDESAKPLDVIVHSLSGSGCLLEYEGSLSVNAKVHVGIAGIPVTLAHIVRRDGNRYGCQFVQPLSDHAVALAGAVDTVHVGAFRSGRTAQPTRDVAVPAWRRAAEWIALAAIMAPLAILLVFMEIYSRTARRLGFPKRYGLEKTQ